MFVSTLPYTFFVLVLSTLYTAFLLEFCAELLEQTVNRICALWSCLPGTTVGSSKIAAMSSGDTFVNLLGIIWLSVCWHTKNQKDATKEAFCMVRTASFVLRSQTNPPPRVNRSRARNFSRKVMTEGRSLSCILWNCWCDNQWEGLFAVLVRHTLVLCKALSAFNT